ncbi:DsbA family protein [Alteromonas lipolytica]|uniref:DSBA-like thioredoxin domain-containing protein n=2 Tax=Alteromonas lipolytica TaxID=1856405 RepID=A0A1E8FA54_9ALTE|nr:hypothetical protein BFC17_06560 [Alteromonas lipolytica]GGF72858.1 DsbA family protein [Alteromonas lipolytica]
MCGWCYGATPLIEVLQANPVIELVMHPGGMIPGRAIEESFRRHILQADSRIAAMTGAKFGERYQAKVSGHEPLILDSYQTALAVVVAQEIAGKGFAMLKAIQSAHFIDGKDTSDLAILQQLAVDLGQGEAEWEKAIAKTKLRLTEIISSSQALMQKLQVRGFPTLLIEKTNQWVTLDHAAFYGHQTGWRDYIAKALGA